MQQTTTSESESLRSTGDSTVNTGNQDESSIDDSDHHSSDSQIMFTGPFSMKLMRKLKRPKYRKFQVTESHYVPSQYTESTGIHLLEKIVENSKDKTRSKYLFTLEDSLCVNLFILIVIVIVIVIEIVISMYLFDHDEDDDDDGSSNTVRVFM